jgi:hypothetical protein
MDNAPQIMPANYMVLRGVRGTASKTGMAKALGLCMSFPISGLFFGHARNHSR